MAVKMSPKKVAPKAPPPENEEEKSEAAAAAAETKEKKAPKDPLVRLLVEPEAKYGGPQVQGILKCLQDNENELKMSELAEKLGEYIQTKQTPARIFAFYRRALENASAIEVV